MGCIFGVSLRLGDYYEFVKIGEFMFVVVFDLGKQLEDGDCIDEYLQDQFIIFMVLVDGVFEIVIGFVIDYIKYVFYYVQIMIDVKFEVMF